MAKVFESEPTMMSPVFEPGNLVVSRAVYDNNPNIIQVGTMLPPNCEKTMGGCSGAAVADGTFPYVFNNALRIDLDEYLVPFRKETR